MSSAAFCVRYRVPRTYFARELIIYAVEIKAAGLDNDHSNNPEIEERGEARELLVTHEMKPIDEEEDEAGLGEVRHALLVSFGIVEKKNGRKMCENAKKKPPETVMKTSE
jgi:hypothetical protein